ncbi:MAG: hypothetical protein K1Y02_09140 [Candidatus Hydrogenedentes bacterium]|nr:hypothetical protein [Candidatus Hydrogenedentota bacterium]
MIPVSSIRRAHRISVQIVIATILIAVIAYAVQGAEQPVPESSVNTYLSLGEHSVEVIDLPLLLDESRNHKLPVRVYTPTDGGPYPVILFSHGAGDSNETAPHLLRHWAGHGYVCVITTHGYEEGRILQRSVSKLVKDMRRPIEMGTAAWSDRIRDITFLMDNLSRFDEYAPALKGKIDATCIGMAGHSYGAFTTQLIAGAELTDPVTSVPATYGDPRPRAFILLSGQGCDPLGLTESSWKKITRPMLVVSGSRDPSPQLDPGIWRTEPYKFAPEGDKYCLYIQGANHLSYIGPLFDIPMPDPLNPSAFRSAWRTVPKTLARMDAGFDQGGIFQYTRIATTAFWDAYLKNDETAKSFLRSEALRDFAQNRLDWEWK